MGLDAVVYRNKHNRTLGDDEPVARVAEDTGEVYFEDNEIARRHHTEREAAHARLGNLATISALRAEIGRIAGPRGLLYTKFVYSGSHSGDIIPVAEFARLSKEISSLRETNGLSEDLGLFLSSVEELLQAAIRERNPIVFV
jgi:hypothetical protein